MVWVRGRVSLVGRMAIALDRYTAPDENFVLGTPYSGPRRAQRACEGAARGVGAPQATEPGSGAEPRPSLTSRILIRARRTIVVALLLWNPAPALAQWTSLGTMTPERQGDALVFHDPRTILSVAALSPEIIRVRFSPTRTFGRDHSYAIVGRDLPDPHATIQTSAGRSLVATS